MSESLRVQAEEAEAARGSSAAAAAVHGHSEKVLGLEQAHAAALSEAESKVRDQHKLAELYQEAHADAEIRLKELGISLKATSAEASRREAEVKQVLDQNVGTIQEVERQLGAATEKTTALNKEIKELKQYGDLSLLEEVQTGGAGKRRRGEVASISPAAELARRYADVNVTVLAERYERAQAALRKTKDENHKLQESLDSVLQEVEKQTPTVSKVYRDLESQSDAYSKLTAKLAGYSRSADRLREEKDVALKDKDVLLDEKDVLQRQMGALKRQMSKMVTMPAAGSKRRRNQLTLQNGVLSPPSKPLVLTNSNASGSEMISVHDVASSSPYKALQCKMEALQQSSQEGVVQRRLDQKLSDMQELRAELEDQVRVSALSARRSPLAMSIAQHAEPSGSHWQVEARAELERQRDKFKHLLQEQIEKWSGHPPEEPGGAMSPKVRPPPELEWKKWFASLKEDYAQSRAEMKGRMSELESKLEAAIKRAASAEMVKMTQQAELETLNIKLEDAEAAETDLTQTRERLRKGIALKEKDLHDNQLRAEKARADKARAELERSDFENSSEIEKRRSAAANQLAQHLGEENQRIGQDKNALAQKVKDLREQLHRKEQEHNAALSTSRDQVKEQVLSQEVEDLREQLRSKEEEHTVTLKKLRDRAEELEQTLRSSQNELRSRSADLATAKRKADAIDTSARQLEAKQRRLDDHTKFASAIHGASASSQQSFEVELERTYLQKQLEGKIEEIAALKTQIKTLHAELVSTEDRYDAKARDVKQKDVQIVSSQQQARAATAAKDALEVERQRLLALGTAAAAEKRRQLAEIGRLNTEKDAAEAERQRLLAAGAAAEEEKHRQEAEIGRLTSEKAVVSAQLEELMRQKAEIDGYRLQAKQAEDTLLSTEINKNKELAAARAEADEAKTNLRELSETLDTLSAGGAGGGLTTTVGADGEEDPGATAAAIEGLREVVKSLRRAWEVAERKLDAEKQRCRCVLEPGGCTASVGHSNSNVLTHPARKQRAEGPAGGLAAAGRGRQPARRGRGGVGRRGGPLCGSTGRPHAAG